MGIGLVQPHGGAVNVAQSGAWNIGVSGTLPISAANVLSAFITNALSTVITNALSAQITNALSAQITNALSAQITNALSAQVTNRPYTIPAGSAFTMADVSGTYSPLGIASGVASGLYVDAVSMTLYSTCNIRIAENAANAVSGGYFVLPSGVVMPLDLYGQSAVWLAGDTASGYVSFIIYQ